MWSGICAGAMAGIFPAMAAAQQGLDCDAPVSLGGASVQAVPDLVHELPAFPGAFGGDVTCVVERTDLGIERYWVEFLPDTERTQEHVTYRSGLISYFLKFSEEETPAQEVAGCERREGGALACRVDLAAGKGLYLARFFGPDLAITSIRVLAYPARGVVTPALWDRVGGAVEDGRFGMEIDLKLPAQGWREALAREAESRPGAPVWGISGEAAGSFMQAIYTETQPIALETRITERVEGQEVVTTAIHDVPEGNLTYLIDKLAKVEQLMVAGFEKSRDMRF